LSVRDTVAIIVRARREGVVLSANANGKLGWRSDRQPSDALLAVLRDNKAEILGLIAPPSCVSLAAERAKRVVARLREFGFRPYLDDNGALLIADATGQGRDPSRFMSIAAVFDQLAAGLADDPRLLDP
jgi:hypothetical protein